MTWWHIVMLVVGIIIALVASFLIWLRWYIFRGSGNRPPMTYSQYMVANELFLETQYEKAKGQYPDRDEFLFIAYLGYLGICGVDDEDIEAVKRMRRTEGHEKTVAELDKPYL